MFCWCYSFFNCLGELISEAIWVWSFLHGKIFNKKKIFFFLRKLLYSSQCNQGFFEGHLLHGAWSGHGCSEDSILIVPLSDTIECIIVSSQAHISDHEFSTVLGLKAEQFSYRTKL